MVATNLLDLLSTLALKLQSSLLYTPIASSIMLVGKKAYIWGHTTALMTFTPCKRIKVKDKKNLAYFTSTDSLRQRPIINLISHTHRKHLEE